MVTSGVAGFDQLVDGLRLGDNVVWQVDELSQYVRFARPFVQRCLKDGHACYYLRFGGHAPVVPPMDGLKLIQLDPAPGFDRFSSQVHRTVESLGRYACYVFDNLSELVVDWATDELVANFFQLTCPFLAELETVAYFGLSRGRHSHTAVARIRDTTQLLVDVYESSGKLYVHPLKVWDRYSPTMFLPHAVEGERWQPVRSSGVAARAAENAGRSPLRSNTGSVAPWDSVHRRLLQHASIEPSPTETAPEVDALRHELARILLGGQPAFERLACEHLSLSDLMAIRDRMVGSGRIGGKAGGMLVARRMLLNQPSDFDFSTILEQHDSFYIGSDVFFSFLVQNGLFRLRMELAGEPIPTHEEFERVEQRFLEGRFPDEVLQQFRSVLGYFGQAPIIVRSSSLQEDSFGNAFAGKYRSEFLVNQGSAEQRLEAFLQAVKLVYASALNPDALAYRRKWGLGQSDEQMAILVQRVSGSSFGPYFMPLLAGVAMSRNLYAWTDRIDASQGMIRLVFGLGTRAVNRVGGDYPRMVALSNPLLRPEVGLAASKYSQREVDLLDMRSNELRTCYLYDVLEETNVPHLHLLASELRDGGLYEALGRTLDAPPSNRVLTFNRLLKETPLVPVLRDMLSKLERGYGMPVDTEFTASLDERGSLRLNLLQCRPLRVHGTVGAVDIPEDMPAERTLFRAYRTISGGVVRGLRYALYIDPLSYAEIDEPARKGSLGRVVGRVNALLGDLDEQVLMLGPGRWGSSNIDLGVNVSYADISNTAVLVELAREESGQVPEVSYGTHFFQDLVEAQIIYLPVYPDDERSQFNEALFRDAPNALARRLPEFAEFADCVHLLDFEEVHRKRIALVADPQSQRALCYLE